jgi:DNA-binding transcriptional regulator YiaG
MATSSSKIESKSTPTPEQKAAQDARRRAARVIGFNTWRDEWRASNPEGTAEERKAAWETARADATKNARKLLRSLEKKGLHIVAADPAEA